MSLLGVEIDKPLINDLSAKYNFTNEGGINKTIRFLKNVMGLWIIQESRRQWKREGKALSFDDMEQAAWNAKPFESFIDPDYTGFFRPRKYAEIHCRVLQKHKSAHSRGNRPCHTLHSAEPCDEIPLFHRMP